MNKLPRWECRDDREAEAMVDWVNKELDRIKAEADMWIRLGETVDADETDKWRPDSETPDWAVTMMVVAKAIERADKGDIEPLRKDLLHLTGHDLARFLKRPKLKRGEQFPKAKLNAVAEAAVTVKIIRRLWRRCYGKVKRPKDDKISAEQIAADRLGVDVVSVINRLKKSRVKQPQTKATLKC